LADDLISHIFHHTQPRETFDQLFQSYWGIYQPLSNTLYELFRGSPIIHRHFTAAFLCLLSNAQQLSSNLEEYFPSTNGKNMALSEYFSRSRMFTIPNIKN
jgi:hypothetical protein